MHILFQAAGLGMTGLEIHLLQVWYVYKAVGLAHFLGFLGFTKAFFSQKSLLK